MWTRIALLDLGAGDGEEPEPADLDELWIDVGGEG